MPTVSLSADVDTKLGLGSTFFVTFLEDFGQNGCRDSVRIAHIGTVVTSVAAQ